MPSRAAMTTTQSSGLVGQPAELDRKKAYVIPAKRRKAENEQAKKENCKKKAAGVVGHDVERRTAKPSKVRGFIPFARPETSPRTAISFAIHPRGKDADSSEAWIDRQGGVTSIVAQDPHIHDPKAPATIPPSLEGVTSKDAKKVVAPLSIVFSETSPSTSPPLPPSSNDKTSVQSSPKLLPIQNNNQLAQIPSATSINQESNKPSPSLPPPFPLDPTEQISLLSWHQMGLAAEAEETSLFGRFRQLAERGLVPDSEAEKMVAIALHFAAIWMATLQNNSDPFKGKTSPSRFQFPFSSKASDDEEAWQWRWSDLQLDAEDRADSIAGATKVLINLRILGADFGVELRRLGVSIAKRWLLASSIPDNVVKGCESSVPASGEFDWQLDEKVMALSDRWG